MLDTISNELQRMILSIESFVKQHYKSTTDPVDLFNYWTETTSCNPESNDAIWLLSYVKKLITLYTLQIKLIIKYRQG